VPICLHRFLVNNRWFKNSYLQDQQVNLKDILCFFVSKEIIIVLKLSNKQK
jgi:hypothetical protein